MALTKVSRGLLSTGIVDNSNATAITLNADESVTFAGGVDVTGAATVGGLTSSGNLTFNAVAINTISSNGFLYYNVPLGYTHTFQSNSTNALSINGQDISFYEDTGTTPKLFWDASAESLGIGTSSPAVKLDVSYADSAFNAGLRVTNTSNTSASQAKVYAVNNAGDYISLGRNSAALGGQSAIFSTGAYPLEFYTNSTLRAQIDASGNVGIGNSSPSTFNQRVNAPHLVVGAGSNAAGLTLFSGTSNQSSINFAVGTTTTQQYDGGIVYHPSHYMSFHTNNGAERMRIDASGNVGIGNSNPSAFNSLGATDKLVIGDSTVSNLTLFGTAYGSLAFADSDTSSSTAQYAGLIQYYHSNNSMQFYTNATACLEMSGAGEIFAYQQYTGGFGALTAGGTASFDHSSNARAGNAYTLLQGIATGGPGGTAYYHVFNYEYASKNSTGNMTQLAYGYNDAKAYMRFRFSGVWGSWVALH